MNATSIDRNENGPAQAKPVKKSDRYIQEIELEVEELEEVIAPGINLANHNETMVADDKEVKLEVEGA